MHLLRITGGKGRGKEFTLREGSYSIGRDNSAQIQLDSSMVSRLHSIVEVAGLSAVIVDQGSINGTMVNGLKIERSKLKHGDKIYIGNFVLEYLFEGERAELEDTFAKKRLSDKMMKEYGDRLKSMASQLSWSSTALIVTLAISFFSGVVLIFLVNSKVDGDLRKASMETAREIVRYLAEKNKLDLASGNEMLLDVDSVAREKWVKEALIVGKNGKILAPLKRQDQEEDSPFVREAMTLSAERTIEVPIYDGLYLFAHPVRVYDPANGQYQTFGAAKIIFSPREFISSTLHASGKVSYFLAVIPALISILIFVLLKRITFVPVRSIVDSTEQARIDGSFEPQTYPREFGDLVQGIRRLTLSLQSLKAQERSIPDQASSPKISPMASDEKIDCIIGAVPMPVMIFDNDRMILAANENAVSFFNLEGEEPVGKTLGEVILDKKLIDAVEDIIEEANASQERIVNKTFEAGFKTIELSVAGVKDHTGRIEFGILLLEKI